MATVARIFWIDNVATEIGRAIVERDVEGSQYCLLPDSCNPPEFRFATKLQSD